MELRPGVALDKHFGSLSDDQKHSVVDQIADTFACIRDAVLINKVNSYGGLTINNGTIVNGQMTTLKGGLWPTYAGFLRAKFTAQFEDADGSPVLGGWRDNGVRKRIDDFLTSGLDTFMPKAGIDTTKRVLLHGDPSESFSHLGLSLRAGTANHLHSNEQHSLRSGDKQDNRPGRLRLRLSQTSLPGGLYIVS